ncbi:hypothetical protein J3F84DRAFT_15087 [Trichoderma pleuroticola]
MPTYQIRRPILFTPVIHVVQLQHCSHNRIRSSTSFDLRRTATAPLNVSPSCFEWEPPKVACRVFLLPSPFRHSSYSSFFQLSFATYLYTLHTLHIINCFPPLPHMHSSRSDLLSYKPKLRTSSHLTSLLPWVGNCVAPALQTCIIAMDAKFPPSSIIFSQYFVFFTKDSLPQACHLGVQWWRPMAVHRLHPTQPFNPVIGPMGV